MQKCCNNMYDPWIDCEPEEMVNVKCKDGYEIGITCSCCRLIWQTFGPKPSYTLIPCDWPGQHCGIPVPPPQDK